MNVSKFNVGELIYFNGFRYHSGYVPRVKDFIPEDNLNAVRANSVGFIAEHVDGFWVLFRMCKGTTSEKV